MTESDNSSLHPPLTDMSHSLMTLLCSLSLHLICVSVNPEQPTPPPPDSRANTHPFNDITFGVMPFSIALILSSICIIQAGDTARARPDKELVISPSISTRMTDVKMETGYYLL